MAETLLAMARALPLLLEDQGIKKRKDVSPKEGEKEYGDVTFADPTNKKYPLDSEKHVKAAWSYINMPRNAGKYSSKDLGAIKGRIKRAAKKFGVAISEDQDFGYDIPITQDHYHLYGSVEDVLTRINLAFHQWRRTLESEIEYRYSSILGVYTDHIVFYTDNWREGLIYYTVSYTVDTTNGSVTILNDVNRVDVTVIVTDLASVGDDGDGNAPTQTATEDKAMAEDKKTPEVEAQDGSTSTTVVKTDAPVGTSADSPTVEQPKTDASSAGPSVPDASTEATSGSPVEKSDDIPVGPSGSDGSSTGTVAGALSDGGAGTKQAQEFEGKDEFFVQSDNYDAANQPMSYIKLQAVEEKDGKKLMTIQGIATRGDIVNSKGQVYPTEVWQENLPRMNELATQGKFLGKLEHPKVEQGLVDAALKFNKFWIQNNDVWFEAVVMPTEPDGKNLQTMIESGVQVDLSSRGYGQFVQCDWRGKQRQVMQKGFICTAIDAVWMGASTGSGVTSVTYQSDSKTVADQGDSPVDKEKKDETQVQSAEDRAAAIRAKGAFDETKKCLLQQSGLSTDGQRAYQAALDKATDGSIESLMGASDAILPSLQSVFPVTQSETTEEAATQSETYSPVFFSKQNAEELAPKTVGEMIDRMVRDLPERYEGQSDPVHKVPSHLTSPREACRLMLQNVARLTAPSFHGPSAARGLLALEQGKIDRAQDILTQGAEYALQSLPTGATTVAGDGAPLSNYLIFPLIRRVFPQYILNEIASIQPMDRPNGKIFWLDQYRTEDPSAGEVTRIDLNTSSSPFNTSYADQDTEGETAKIIRMKLSSQLIEAHTKKLGAAWSIEEMQDLRAYHGLDAAQELLAGVARELALEINAEVLNDMILQASAGALEFGTTMPTTGFDNQPEWDAYIWNYVSKMENIIFSKRNGGITHLICGMDAALALAKSNRMAISVATGGDGAMNEQYPGVAVMNLVSGTGQRYRILKTNFWGSGTTNGAKIMAFRRGTEWNDVPYVYAPYADFTTPMFTDPLTFDQKQGVMSRFAKKCVTPDAIGTIEVKNQTGALV